MAPIPYDSAKSNSLPLRVELGKGAGEALLTGGLHRGYRNETACGVQRLDHLLSKLSIAYRYMTSTITLSPISIERLDLTPVRQVVDPWLAAGTIAQYEQTLQFAIEFPRVPDDPRELSEIPELRLWFIRLDSCYPWFPFLLDGRSGELARYTAMLVPHQFQRVEGIRYNPEALEIFVMQKIFVLSDWLQQQSIPSRNRLKAMAQLLGYELDDAFFELLSDERG